MNNIFSSPLFFILLTVGSYTFFSFLYTKTKFGLFNPLLLSAATIIIYLIATKISVEKYQNNLILISSFLSPLTVSLAIPVYNRMHIVKTYTIPILIGTIVGASVSMLSVFLLGKLFGLTPDLIASLLPKSVTTPIAVEISKNLGGIEAVTVSAVVVTGVLGSLFGPLLLKLFKITRSAPIGMSLGGCSHAVGTSKAVEISARAGAIASVAIVTSGIFTSLIAIFLF